MIEELPDRRSQAGARPDITKAAPELAKVLYKDGSIQGTTKRTANKGSRGFGRHIDGLIHRCDFGDRDAAVNCI